MKLFGTDGVRGKAGKKLNAFMAMRLAMAAGIYFRKNSITNIILVGKGSKNYINNKGDAKTSPQYIKYPL